MENEKTIRQTFRAIRQLPLEVSFQQVEQWVRQQPAFEMKKTSWWMRLVLKFGWSKSDN